jgi:hypothetical protein
MRRRPIASSCTRPWRPRLLWPQAVAASILVLGQLLGTLHFALVEHVVCVEHGEIAHVGNAEGFGARAESIQRGTTELVNPGLSKWFQRGSSEDHPHCLVQALRRDSATRTRIPISVVTDRLTDGAQSLPGIPHAENAVLFRLAPKHSPPI